MLELIVDALKDSKGNSELILRAKGRYKLPSNFKELKNNIKLRYYGKQRN